MFCFGGSSTCLGICLAVLLPLRLAASKKLVDSALEGSASIYEVAGCPRRALADLEPTLSRMESAGSAQDGAACSRAARQLYCEVVQDVYEPMPLEDTCATSTAVAAPMQLTAEGDVRIALLVFMVDEVEAVQELLAYLGPEDGAVVHVDLRHPAAFGAMSQWALGRPNILIRSRWAVARSGYSAAASLLDLLDIALAELNYWEFCIFVSASHFPIRPRAELARFLWYHPMSYASSEEGVLDLANFPPLAHHLQVVFECSGELWDLMRDGLQQTTILPQLGHPNITVAHGQPFVTLRRDFVGWIGQMRKIPGSSVWVLLRHLLRTWCNVEKLFQTLLKNTEWCHRASFRQDLTYAKMGLEQQEQHHGKSRSVDGGPEDKAVTSASLLRPTDLPELATARANHWVRTGFVGVPEFESLERRITPGFVAFARKVDPDLRRLLAPVALEEIPWETWDVWPIAFEAWELLMPDCSHDGLEVLRRNCGHVGNRAPCGAELRLSAPGCNSSLVLWERVGKSAGQVYAVQIGGGWDPDKRAFASPGIVSNASLVQAEFFVAFRSREQLEQEVMTKVVLLPPENATAQALGTAFDLRDVQGSGSASFGARDDSILSGGEWRFAIVDAHTLEVMAERPFYVYDDASSITLEVLKKYFQWLRLRNED